MIKGFAPQQKSQPVQRNYYQRYTAELKRRYITDNSELLFATAEILISKRLHDPIAFTQKRKVWDCFAIACAYHLLFLEESQSRGVNQVFIFDNRFRLIERVETNPWKEIHTESGEVKEIKDTDWQVIDLAAKECQFNIEWLKQPQST